jgi:hypothetical protein
MRQKVKVEMHASPPWAVEEVQTLARSIRGHPTITSFDSCLNVPYESIDSLYSALVTLPALESVKLYNIERQARPEDESAFSHPGSLTKVLQVPSLQSVCFGRFSFTPALCQATANALMEGTAVTKLVFRRCSFLDGECTRMMANYLSRNTSVSHIRVILAPDRTLLRALATALPLNSTMRDLFISGSRYDDNLNLSPVFSALGTNKGLKTLTLYSFGSINEALSTAMKDGLGTNVTLESLQLNDVHLSHDNAEFWCRAFSFLRTNKALKSLIVNMQRDITESCLSAFRIDIAAMLHDNASLESISILTWKGIKAEDYIVLVTALQHNSRLKTVCLKGSERLQWNDDEIKQMASLLKKNYALESLPDIDLKNEAGDIGTILRLNEAGRRYLIEDGSSISKGVEVLSRVYNEINCVFFHLLENPRLCDRSAVERNNSSTSPTSGSVGGKREPVSVHRGKESRRRLA